MGTNSLNREERQRFLPRGAVTGIGSLPYTNVAEALALIARMCPEIPFWPQLPYASLHEAMIEQALGPLLSYFTRRQGHYGYRAHPGHLSACFHAFSHMQYGLEEQSARGFFAFEQALEEGLFPHARALKAQGVGPITLACQLFMEDQAFLFEPEALDAVCQAVIHLASWQMQRWQHRRQPVLYFLDEPCLGLLGATPYQMIESRAINALHQVVHAIQHMGAIVGVHCCAHLSSGAQLCQVEPDIISFDAYQDLEVMSQDTHIQDFLHQGGQLAFGLVPTRDETPDPQLLFTRWLLAYSQSDVRHIAESSLITATCGLGLLSPSRTETIFDVTQRLSKLVRHVAKSPD